MPQRPDGVWVLCGGCHANARKRIDGACANIKGKSVDWWAEWWRLEEEKQMKCFRECDECNGLIVQ